MAEIIDVGDARHAGACILQLAQLLLTAHNACNYFSLLAIPSI